MAYYHIKVRRDTASNWSSNNPTPVSGEVCYETDTKKLKIGDGSTAYNSLTYFTLPAATTSSAGLMSAADKSKLNGITISLYAKLNSPEFSGVPQVPAIPNPYNVESKQIATLDHVQQAIAYSRSVPSIALVYNVGSSGEYPIINAGALPLVQAIAVNGEARPIKEQTKLNPGNSIVEIVFRDYSQHLYRHTIPADSFKDISNFKYAVLSPDILQIGDGSFSGTQLLDIYCTGSVAPSLNGTPFANSPLKAGGNVYVPESAKNDFNDKWTFGANIINF